MMISIAFCLLTLFLTRTLFLKFNDAILASIFASITLCLQAYIFDFQELYPLIFGCSFVGMSTIKVLTCKPYYFTAILYPAVLLLVGKVDLPVGGLLGLSAFITVIIVKRLEGLIKYEG